MRTSESASVQASYPHPTQLSSDRLLNSTPESIVLTRMAADLRGWIDCSWIVGLVSGERDLRVACVMGTPPDLPGCIERVTATVRLAAETLCVETNGGGAPPILAARIPNVPGIALSLAIGPKNGGQRYSGRDRALICELCASIGAILSNARLAQAMSAEVVESNRIRTDFETANDLQDRFLPSDTAMVEGLEYYGSSRRCGALGGDFFGFLRLHPAQLVMTLGRVAPVGSPAAVLAAGLQATLRTLLTYETDLARVSQELNRMMWDVSPGDVFSTLLFVRIDPSHRKLEYVSAGQEAAYLIRARDHRVETLESSGAVLGLSRRSVYVKRTVSVEPGDVVIALTDGIADAVAPGDLPFIQALPNLLRSLSSIAARDLAARVLEAVEVFTGRPAEIADRTVTAIRINKSVYSRAHAIAA